MPARDELPEVYDARYRGDYRRRLVGYEVARWHALDHLLRKVVPLGTVERVLDYGAGSGLFLPLWRERFPEAELSACEISAVALERLRADHPDLADRARLMEDERAPFEDGRFDLVVSVEVMEHVADLDRYLADIRRLLRPGGWFVWTTPCGNALSIEHLFSRLTFQIESTAEGYRRWKWEEPTHVRRLKTREIAERLADHRFDDVGFRLRSHLFSIPCTVLFRGPLRPLGERLMRLDYLLFRRLPNGGSMLGFARAS